MIKTALLHLLAHIIQQLKCILAHSRLSPSFSALQPYKSPTEAGVIQVCHLVEPISLFFAVKLQFIFVY